MYTRRVLTFEFPTAYTLRPVAGCGEFRVLRPAGGGFRVLRPAGGRVPGSKAGWEAGSGF